MKKIAYPLFLTAAFLSLPFGAFAASVTIDSIPATICRLSTFSGTASFGAQDVLTVSLDGTNIGTITGGTSWSVAVPSSMTTASHTLTAQVSSTTAGVLATATATFGVNCGTMDPDAVMQVWGLTGHNTPKTAYGQTITDEFGLKDTCAYFIGCFNIAKTDYYRLPVIKYLLQK